VAPLVGVLGNDELALAMVMTAGMVIALVALLVAGVSDSDDDAVAAGMVADSV
jgi:DHA1 family bicyclomycin/chloramphenicol resistance-like MFS transporter